ncbi:S66 peptidase family protein [Anaeromicropila herbilytica]|uniref:Putative murein peptide carboxypeptidase n=1 Tax=Anaeromicropila herbilytica TaxID=2785025 RepID=A0A7R7IEU1_9FIRM|nr:LD-carboxypeptidase [Anaeromicropila herbilytica]BCN32479.1 putative murein peptide carboxypeptidase [Anaeromicropila herbilytica]
MIRAESLYVGARVALIAPAGPVKDDRLNLAIDSVVNMGLTPVVFESCISKHGYLAGEDALRVHDINASFDDPSIQGIICMRGGYGVSRILSQVDYKMISANPKIFCGYSDITALHIVINQICSLETYHTPMLASELYKGVDDYTMYYFQKMLFYNKIGPLLNADGNEMKTIVDGVSEGILTGGNLTMVVSSLGTPFEINTKGKILFLEEVDEEIYRIDRMLTQLKNAGKFADCKGIIIGQFANCESKDKENSLTMEQVLQELIVPENKPCINNFTCGHVATTLSLPMGAYIRMDAINNKIEVIG